MCCHPQRLPNTTQGRRDDRATLVDAQVALAAKPLAALAGVDSMALYGGGRDGKDAQLEQLLTVRRPPPAGLACCMG